MLRRLLLIPACLAAAACSGSTDDGVVDVAFIATPEELFADGLRLAAAGQHLRGATTQGLVRFDEAGRVVPALAERWIVTDDGASYIFRIREFDLADGTRLTAQSVRDSLVRSIARLEGTSLGYDLAKIAEIRAMTGRVIEIRLTGQMPDLLQLLAQPELGIDTGATLSGPMRLTRADDVARLTAMPPEARGLPAQEGWAEGVMPVHVTATGARAAVDGFSRGVFDLVLNGRLASLPLADVGPLSRGTVRLDSAIGLFGLDVMETEGFLAEARNREALALAIDRSSLLQAFNIGGWIPTTRLVAPGLPGDTGAVGERWEELTLEQRQAQASARVAAWEAATGADVTLSIGLPEGPGSDLLFEAIAGDLAAVGIAATQAGLGDGADLELRDRVARYGHARWFLNQFNCNVSRRQCSPDADYLVELAATATDAAEQVSFLEEAETVLTAENLFIPFGAPIRWSLARADVAGFIENPWNIHPLFALSRAPI